MKTIISSFGENHSKIDVGLFKEIAEKAPVGILLSDGKTKQIVYANPAFTQTTGYQEADVLGRDCSFLQGDEKEQPEVQEIRKALDLGQGFHGILQNFRKDGSLFYNELWISPVLGGEGDLLYFVGYLQDVTQEKRRSLFLEMLIQIGEMLNDTLYDEADESVLEIVSREIGKVSLFQIAAVCQVEESTISYLSATGRGIPSIEKVCGNTEAGPCPLTLLAWRSNEIAFDNHYPDHPERVMVRQLMIDHRWYSGAVVPVLIDGRVSYALALVSGLYGVFDSEVLHALRRIKTMVEDFFTRKSEFASRAELSRKDPMTGLVNRMAFGEIFTEVLTRTRQKKTNTAIVYVDLDGFKRINDGHGHEAGDQVLKSVGERIRQVMRQDDTAVRLGGDEFLLLLEGVDDLSDLEKFLQRLSEALEVPISWNQVDFSIQASFGVTIFPKDSGDVDSLLHHADQAMYTHKRADRKNRGLYVLYPPIAPDFLK